MHGKVLLTTPNGMQFDNPFRRKNKQQGYRCYAYERHNGLFTLEELVDLTEKSGFRILDSGYWNVYARQGMSRFYGLMQALPLRYCQEKFCRTIYVIAEKMCGKDHLDGYPLAYVPNPDWEKIQPSNVSPGN